MVKPSAARLFAVHNTKHPVFWHNMLSNKWFTTCRFYCIIGVLSSQTVCQGKVQINCVYTLNNTAANAQRKRKYTQEPCHLSNTCLCFCSNCFPLCASVCVCVCVCIYVTRYHERYTKSLAANGATRLNKLCDPILSILS